MFNLLLLESLASLATADIECLVIAGGSEYGTVEVLRRQDSMHKGFGWSRGKWSCSLSAGNTLREGMLQRMLELASGSVPRPGLFCAKVEIVDPKGLALNDSYPVGRGHAGRLLRANCSAHQAAGTMHHRRVLPTIGFQLPRAALTQPYRSYRNDLSKARAQHEACSFNPRPQAEGSRLALLWQQLRSRGAACLHRVLTPLLMQL